MTQLSEVLCTSTSLQFQQQVQNCDSSEGESYDSSREETSHPASAVGLADIHKGFARLISESNFIYVYQDAA